MHCDLQMMTIIKTLQEAVRQAMTKDDPDEVLMAFVSRIGAFLGAEKAFLFDDTPIHFYCWTAGGMAYDTKRIIQKDARKRLRSWFKVMARQGDPVLIADTASCPDLAPAMKKSMRSSSIHSLAAIGISMPGNRVGALSLENIPPDAMGRADELLRLTGSFILMLLRNRDHIYQLRNNSFIDQMTGVSNRNAFDTYQQHIDGQVSMGVLFADINNLKETNDKQGHASGDRLICDTALVLLQQRQGGEVFRIGGDEFVIIWQHIEEQEFYRVCCQIRRKFSVQGLNIALGQHWVTEAGESIAPILQAADKHMYEEKRRYHERQGIRD